MNWKQWSSYFKKNRQKPAKFKAQPFKPFAAAQELAKSLAIFQLGETGEGRIIRQIQTAAIPYIDQSYRQALADFIGEEGRHARLLAQCVHLLGGELIQKNWTATAFVKVRRLIGIRMKLLVLLSAEVVGLCFYEYLALAMPVPEIKRVLFDICDDERAHLQFHCDFFKSQIQNPIHALLFKLGWKILGAASAGAVVLSHRKTLKAIGVSKYQATRRFFEILHFTEQQVLQLHPSEHAVLPRGWQPFVFKEVVS